MKSRSQERFYNYLSYL